jgi:ribosomal protein S18 acetylase RimI-like enzyme
MADASPAAPEIRLLAAGPAAADDVARVAALHRRALPHTGSSRAGDGAVRTLYAALLDDPAAAVLLAASGQEGAFAAGTVRLRETERLVRRAVSRRRALAARLALSNLLAPAHLLAQLAWAGAVPPGAGYVLTIGASEGSPVRGRSVLEALEGELRRRGAGEIWVDTEAANVRAVAFYERNGYAVASRRFRQVLLRKPAP